MLSEEREGNPELTVEQVVRRHTSNIKWDRELKGNLRQKKKTEFDDNYIRKVVYRPFVATNCYADYTLCTEKVSMDRIFPNSSSENSVICVPSKGLKNPFQH